MTEPASHHKTWAGIRAGLLSTDTVEDYLYAAVGRAPDLVGVEDGRSASPLPSTGT